MKRFEDSNKLWACYTLHDLVVAGLLKCDEELSIKLFHNLSCTLAQSKSTIVLRYTGDGFVIENERPTLFVIEIAKKLGIPRNLKYLLKSWTGWELVYRKSDGRRLSEIRSQYFDTFLREFHFESMSWPDRNNEVEISVVAESIDEKKLRSFIESTGVKVSKITYSSSYGVTIGASVTLGAIVNNGTYPYIGTSSLYFKFKDLLHVITCEHVVDGGTNFTFLFCESDKPDSEAIPMEIISSDRTTDLAVLKMMVPVEFNLKRIDKETKEEEKNDSKTGEVVWEEESSSLEELYKPIADGTVYPQTICFTGAKSLSLRNFGQYIFRSKVELFQKNQPRMYADVFQIKWEKDSPLPEPGDSGGICYYWEGKDAVPFGMIVGTKPADKISIAVPLDTIRNLMHMQYDDFFAELLW